MAEDQLKAYLDDASKRRREAYKANNQKEYVRIVSEVQEQRMNKSSEIQEKISAELGLSSDEFQKATNSLIENDRTLELTNAQQGQLIDIQLEEDEAANLILSEEKTLEVFEIMLRS